MRGLLGRNQGLISFFSIPAMVAVAHEADSHG